MPRSGFGVLVTRTDDAERAHAILWDLRASDASAAEAAVEQAIGDGEAPDLG